MLNWLLFRFAEPELNSQRTVTYQNQVCVFSLLSEDYCVVSVMAEKFIDNSVIKKFIHITTFLFNLNA